MSRRKNKKDLLNRKTTGKIGKQTTSAASDVTTLYVVRHGTTEMNEQFCFQGDLDIPLNDLGLKQGALLTDYFKDIHIDVGATSPLSRAKKTLEFMLAGHDNVPVIEDKNLIEMNFGIGEGRPIREVSLFFPDAIKEVGHHPGKFNAVGGETAAHALERFNNAVMNIVHDHRGETIALATHGFVMTLWLGYVQGYSLEDTPDETPENVAVSKFTIDANDHVTVEYLNDDHHIPDDLKRGYDFNNLAKAAPLFIYYPKCTTCKKAKKFLDDHNVTYLSRDLVKEKLRSEEILALMARWDKKPRQFFNTSGKLYREQHLKDVIGDWNEQQMADKLSEDGMLLKRPILVMEDKVLLGFKPEKWADALGLELEAEA